MVKKILRLLKSFFYGIRTSRIVCQLINLTHKKRFTLNPPNLNSSEQDILEKINNDGVSQCSIEEFFDLKSVQLIESRGKKIREFLAHSINSNNSTDFGGKDFLVRYYDMKKNLEIEDQLIFEVVQGSFFDIARTYFGQDVKISNIDYWLNFDNQKEENPISSQKWHRDYEDERVLKIFLYFEDVTLNHGPFSYVKKTHKSGKHKDIYPVSPPLGISLSDQQVSNYFCEKEIKEFQVPKGTILFADTAGIHKGGLCFKETRFLFTATYTSFAGISPRNYEIYNIDLKSFRGHSKRALGYF